jgi:hypothetical protein
MESILIHPESEEQLKAVKAFLKALKVRFEQQPTALPDHVSKSIEKGLKQFEDGQTISLDEFKRRHFTGK